MPRKCPTCGRAVPAPVDAEPRTGAGAAAFPFCSDRCRLADLGKWLDGAYRIGAPMAEEDLDEGLPAEGRDGDDDKSHSGSKLRQ